MPTVRVLVGDALARLQQLPDSSVHCVVTSPPYYGLRDYGTGEWDGGDPNCDHRGPRKSFAADLNRNTHGIADPVSTKQTETRHPYRDRCDRCGASRRDLQVGLEETPDAYVARLVVIFAEVRRVLRPDGTVWLNLGDTYCTVPHGVTGRTGTDPKEPERAKAPGQNRRPLPGLKHKDLLMIPERVALALQAAGWWVRSRIHWWKRNCMPYSGTDRPTCDAETVWLLAPASRYFYDHYAVREPDQGADHPRHILHRPEPSGGLFAPHRGIRRSRGRNGQGRNLRSTWDIPVKPFAGVVCLHCHRYLPAGPTKPRQFFGGLHLSACADPACELDHDALACCPGCQATHDPDHDRPAFSSHFATFPPDLARRCILAGTSAAGVCTRCGAPWSRVVEPTGHVNRRVPAHVPGNSRTKTSSRGWAPSARPTDRWVQSCDCPPGDPVPATVLDPFGGAGTTALVAAELGRDAVSIDLSVHYAHLQAGRIRAAHLPGASVQVLHEDEGSPPCRDT